MKLSRNKKILLALICALMLGFNLTKKNFAPPEMKDWPVDLSGPTVEPVSKVALFRSDKAEAEDIEYAEIQSLVRQAIESVGGLETIVTDGDSVILKPNLVGSGGKRPEVNGVTTDYRVVKALSEIVRELNPNGWIGILEGAAPGNNQGTRDMYELYDYNKENLPLVDDIICLEDVSGDERDYSSKKLVAVKLPDGKGLYPNTRKPNLSDDLYFARLFYNADAIISIPVLKNHESAALTCAVKNTSIGMLPTSIYAINKWNIPNLRFEIEHGYPFMHYWLHDYYMARPVDFVLVDGLQGLEYGPGSSDPNHRMNMRLIMAGNDLISVDAIAAYIIGMDAELIDYLVYLHNDGIGCVDHRLIRIEGNASVSDVKKSYRHHNQNTKDRMVKDKTPPDVAINNVQVSGNTMTLNLDVAEETELVEVLVDGQKLSQNVIAGFESVQITDDAIGGNGQDITVVAYDQYRNSKSTSITTSVGAEPVHVAREFQLYQNWPNPFNPSTNIRYQLPESAQVRLSVYTLNGALVRVLENGIQNAGEHQSIWNGENSQGNAVASGVYIYRLEARSGSEVFNQSAKMTLTR